MAGSAFDGCDDSCGWIAAVVASLAYGSYGLPIKATTHIDVHPLVFQSYKTLTMFTTCWLVVCMGVKPVWTWWGILSGMLWVLGGTGGIYAIRNAGMAIAVGTWASVMVCINFIWGILVFHEPVADVWGTLGAFVCLALGLVGMARYSALQEKTREQAELEEQDPEQAPSSVLMEATSTTRLLQHSVPREEIRRRLEMADDESESSEVIAANTELLLLPDSKQEDTVTFLGFEFSRRSAGILGAVFNGVMTGSSLLPLHYAKQEGIGGADFFLSYGSGALIANSFLWAAFFAYVCVQQIRSGVVESILEQSWKSMPLWHVRQLVVPGIIAGFLLSVAIFGAILSVTYLGQAVGNSVIQSKILISGLWGIIWYKEVTGCSTITSWFVSAAVAVIGILWLSHERLAAKGGDDDHNHFLLL